MPTAVVVATIVNTTMSESGFRQHMAKQLHVNDRKLLDRLSDADGDADVVTAVLNVDKLLAYLTRRCSTAVEVTISTAELNHAAATEWAKACVDTAEMSEGEFMNYVLKQLESEEIEL
jgi:hypothetical protein